MAGLAGLLPQNVHLYLRSFHRLPEIDVQPIFEIGSTLRLVSCLARARPEELAENITESAPSSFPGVVTSTGSTARGLLLAYVLAEIKSTEARSATLAAPRPSAIRRRHVVRIK